MPDGYNVEQQQIRSNASRKRWRYVFAFNLNLNFRLRYLTNIWRSKGGRGSGGRRILWTRGTRNWHIKIPHVNFRFWIRAIAFVVDFVIVASRNSFATLICLSNGSLLFVSSMEGWSRFQYFHLFKPRRRKKYSFSYWFAFLGKIPKLTLVSLIELTPGQGAQYARSRGARSRLFSFDFLRRLAILKLPSKIQKTFSLYSVAALKPLMGEGLRYKNSCAGYWKRLGFKSVVRGIAMNPVDHPHGGRTKSIRYPLTPWGKTTKKK